MGTNLILILMVFFGFWALSQQTVDLNLRQLQYVSDHLTTKECRRLITALYQKTFQLKPKQLRPIQDKEPCLSHLVTWNQQTGDEGSVEDLTVRLHQIGRTDLAREIAHAVYGETSREIHKYFLDNPFKATSHRKGSRLMEDADEEKQKKTKAMMVLDGLRNALSRRRFALAVMTLTLTLSVIGGAAAFVYCQGACFTMCPKRLVATYQAVQESLKETWTSMKSLTATELMGKKKEHVRRPPPLGEASREEQDRLVQKILAV